MKNIKLFVPTPCHENWNAMTPQDRGRFCAACQKTVVDFSVMSDQQLATFFKKPVGSVCGRFSDQQLGRTIEVPRKQHPWVKYFFTIAIPAFLWSIKATAQGEAKGRRTLGRVAVCEKPKTDTVKTAGEQPPQIANIKGRVLDESGVGIPHATIMFKGTQNGVSADAEGWFELKRKDPGLKEIVVSSVGYEIATVPLNDSGEQTITLTLRRMDYMGIVIVTEKRKPKQIPLLQQLKRDSSLKRFSIYPNPAPSGSMIFLDPTRLEAARYSVLILSTNGTALQTTELTVGPNKNKASIQLPVIPAGSYFIQLTNKYSGKSFTEVVIVQ